MISAKTAQTQLNLLQKEVSNLYAEVLESVINKYPSVKLTVEGAEEYDDNNYYTDVRYYVDDFKLDEYSLSEGDYEEDKDKITKLQQKGVDLHEILEYLYLIPTSYWSDTYGSSFNVKINATFIKKLKRGKN